MPSVSSLVTLPVDAPLEEMFAVIKRDGGLIVSGFLTPEEVDEFNEKADPLFNARLPTNERKQLLAEMGVDFHAPNTVHLRGMLGLLPEQVSKVVLHPVWHALMTEVLKTQVHAYVGEQLMTTDTSYLLSLAVGFRVTPGATNQVLHRDQTIHSVDAKEGSLYTSDLGCLIAGSRSTRKNGATRVVPGSHLWPPTRSPRADEAVYAEMEPGSAMFWFGSTYHGASANECTLGEPDDTRTLYGMFGCCDFLRQEENQQLVCPESVARTLHPEVLRRTGWTKGAGGCGFVEASDPASALGFPGFAKLEHLKA
ncbi:hypothetical protein JCM10207_007755 [Rhodosporidiobolus poonsookiae]